MAFDWDKYLSIAKDFENKAISETNDSLKEAMQRVALSRAYYSMYHLAVGYAKANFNYTPSNTGPNQHHSDIRGEYRKRLDNPNLQEIKNILLRMHKARLDADYSSESLGNTNNLLKSIILDADRIKNILN